VGAEDGDDLRAMVPRVWGGGVCIKRACIERAYIERV
jgi:hypothetical protein